MSTEPQNENLIEIVGKVDYMYKQINTLSTKFEFLIDRFHDFECRLVDTESKLDFILKGIIFLVSIMCVRITCDFIKLFL